MRRTRSSLTAREHNLQRCPIRRRPPGWYDAFGRRAFFALDPERSHRVALAMLALPLPWPRIGRAVADPALATTVAGVPLAQPDRARGRVRQDVRPSRRLGALGFGYVVGGTVTLASAPREPPPADRPRPRRGARS